MTAVTAEETTEAATTETVKAPTAKQAAALVAKAKVEAAIKLAAEEDKAAKESQALRSRLLNESKRELMNNHHEEFTKIADAKFAEHGLVFTRRMTDAEKAAKKIADLLEAHPELAGQFGQATPVDAQVEVAEEAVAVADLTVPAFVVPDYDTAYIPEVHGTEPVSEADREEPAY